MIGVFDSGYGGLTVLKALQDRLPQYNYLYLGDNARAPYGARSPETILQYSREAVDFLFAQGARLIVVACNTVSAVALRQLQEEYLRAPGVTDRKILGVIFPLAEEAVRQANGGVIGVVGTTATVESKAYEREIQKVAPASKIVHQACPLLVPFIEEGWDQKPEAMRVLRKYVRSLKNAHVDLLILGCTHYPLMHRQFERAMGQRVNVMDTGPTVAESLADYLHRHPEIEKPLSGQTGQRVYMTTGDPKRFQELGSRFLGVSIREVRKVALGGTICS